MIFLVFSLFSSSAFAFTLAGSPYVKGYENPAIEIRINQGSCPSNVDLRKVIEDSIKVWNRVPSSKLKLSVGGSTTETGYTYPPVAYCDNTITGGILGMGGSAMSDEFKLVLGMIRFNSNPASTGYILNQEYGQILIVAAHEIGHLIGLGHSEDTYALMNYSIGSKVTMNLSQDDIDGVTFLYPQDEVKGAPFMGGCGLVQSAKPSGHGRMIWLFFLFPLLLWAWLRSKTSHLFLTRAIDHPLDAKLINE